MAGNHADTSVHRIVSGEAPTVGLAVIDNNLDRGVIAKVDTTGKCGYYCEAWHTVEYRTDDDATFTRIMNCDRLTTRMPM